MTASRSLRPVKLIVAAVAAMLALAFAACGGSGGGGDGGADPAGAVPATAPVYLEASIKPQGSQKAAVDALSKRLIGVDNPGKAIQDRITASASSSDKEFSYEKDIKPWLGDRVAFFVNTLRPSTGVSSSSGEGAFVAAVSDTDKAKDTLKNVAEKGKAKQSTYNDVDYYATGSGGAAGVVGDYLVISSDLASFKQAVDAEKGDSLADDADYKGSPAANSADKLGSIFVDPKSLITQLSTGGQFAGQGAQFQQLLQQVGNKPVTGSLSATPDSLTLELAGPAAAGAAADSESTVLPSLPGDAWAAIGIPKLGTRIDQSLKQAEASGSAQSQQIAAIERQLEQQTGISVSRDIIPASGDAAIFARGTSMADLSVGVVVKAPDTAAAARFVARLKQVVARSAASGGTTKVRTIPGGFQIATAQLPKPISVVLRGDQWVVVYGDAADVNTALAPNGTLGDNADFKTAAQSLQGAPVSLFVAFQPILKLVESRSGGLAASQAQQVLSQLSTLAFGGKAGAGATATALMVLQLTQQ